jgi:sterol 24-C-methyltransferase
LLQHLESRQLIFKLPSNTSFPNMPSTVTLEPENWQRDAAFNKAMHGKSIDGYGLSALRNKDAASQKAAIDEYFKHWDNKTADIETEEIRKARRDEYATLTRQ